MNHTRIVIRAAEAGDIPAILTLSELWRAEQLTIKGFYGRLWQPNTPELLERFLGPLFLVAARENETVSELVGFAFGEIRLEGALENPDPMIYQVVGRGGRYLEIEQVYVHPDFRSRGTGSALVRKLLQNAAGLGITHATLVSANEDLDSILKFYRKQGFQHWFIRMFYQAPQDE